MKPNISYTKRILWGTRIKIIGYLVLLLCAGFIAIGAGIFDLVRDDKWRNPIVWFGLSVFILGVLYAKLLELFLKWQGKSQDKLYEENRRSYEGVIGEDALFEWAGNIFDSNYHQFRNFIIPGGKFDIDLVSVGPKGIFMFEVKKSSNPIDFQNGKAFFAGTDRPLPFDPLGEIERHHNALSKYLEASGYNSEAIHKALVIVGDRKFIGKPGIFIADSGESLKRYVDYIQDNSQHYTAEFCDKLSKLLNSNK